MKRVVAYWADGYDWRRSEAELNRFPNYRARIDGLDVHFIMERGSGKNPPPLILTHGWPGSVIEFLGVIEPLAHPERFGGREEDAFTVIVPSIPGFGFSQAPKAPITLREVGGMWRNLMVDHLGFDTFFVQGGDMGSICSCWMSFDHPKHVTALHLNTVSFLALPEADSSRRRSRTGSAGRIAWRASGRRLSDAAGNAATDVGLWAHRFPGGPGGLDHREVPRLDSARRSCATHLSDWMSCSPT